MQSIRLSQVVSEVGLDDMRIVLGRRFWSEPTNLNMVSPLVSTSTASVGVYLLAFLLLVSHASARTSLARLTRHVSAVVVSPQQRCSLCSAAVCCCVEARLSICVTLETAAFRQWVNCGRRDPTCISLHNLSCTIYLGNHVIQSLLGF